MANIVLERILHVRSKQQNTTAVGGLDEPAIVDIHFTSTFESFSFSPSLFFAMKTENVVCTMHTTPMNHVHEGSWQ